MSELGEMYAAMRGRSADRKARRRTSAPAGLASRGVAFESKNEGAHLIVDGGTLGKIDFWPGTGLWVERKSGRRRRGFGALVRRITGLL